MSTTLIEVALGLLVGLGLASTTVVLALIGLRGTAPWRDRRAERRRGRTRRVLLALVLEDPDGAQRAHEQIAAGEAGRPAEIEAEAFALLAKVRGEPADQLRAILLATDAEWRARRLARSRASVRRCRGAYRLGLLRSPAAVWALSGLLEDRDARVRRTAVRALGAVGDPSVLPALLDRVDVDRGLRRDLIHAVALLEPAVCSRLRSRLREGLASPEPASRVPEFCAYLLGRHGDRAALDLLLTALARPEPRLSAAAAEALGEIADPTARLPLEAALRHPSAQTRAAAAAALGRIGDPASAAALGAAFDPDDRVLSRRVGAALLRLGAAGRAELAGSSSPYAVEAREVGALRGVPA